MKLNLKPWIGWVIEITSIKNWNIIATEINEMNTSDVLAINPSFAGSDIPLYIEITDYTPFFLFWGRFPSSDGNMIIKDITLFRTMRQKDVCDDLSKYLENVLENRKKAIGNIVDEILKQKTINQK